MKTTPEISYIISAYNRPALLPVCLWSLYAQTHTDFEVLVTDNATDKKIAAKQRDIVASMKDSRFKYVNTATRIKVSDCYWSAEYGMKHTTGKWICFPCDDTYYVPQWAQRMLTTAVSGNLDLVLCESAVYGPDTNGCSTYYLAHRSDIWPGGKPSFLVKRSVFPSFINKPTVSTCSGVDRATLLAMTNDRRIKHGGCSGLYYVHN